MSRAPGPHRPHGPRQDAIVEVPRPAHDDDVGRAVAGVDGTPFGDGLADAGAGADHHPLPRLHHGGGHLGGGDEVGGIGRDAEPVEFGLVLGDGQRRVVRDQYDPLAGPQLGHRLGRPGDRAVGQPHDTIEIEDPGHGPEALAPGRRMPAYTGRHTGLLRLPGASLRALRRPAVRARRHRPLRGDLPALRRHLRVPAPLPSKPSTRPTASASSFLSRPGAGPLHRRRRPAAGLAPARRAAGPR